MADSLPINVQVKLVVISIHEVDTLNEKFTAELYIESRWPLKHEANNDDNSFLNKNWKPKWTPDLNILNVVVKDRCKCWYKIGEIDKIMFIFEMKRFKITIYEKFELNYYPFDLQILNIQIISNHKSENCLLKKTDLNSPSYIHTENFRDSQEWYLYNYIDVKDNLKQNTEYTNDENEHSLIKFHCAVARKPDYFYWNSFFIIFLITIMSFNAFSFSYTLISNRLSTTISLILASISFKWVINRNLPPIPYLTTIDIYSINSIFFLTILSCWHVLIGYFHNNLDLIWVDRGFLIASGIGFIIYHFIYVCVLYYRNFAPRRLYSALEKTTKVNHKFSSDKAIKFY